MLNVSHSTELTQKFFGQYRSLKVQKGTLLLLPGDTVSEVTYIEEGMVIQYAITENGSKIILNSYKAGAFIPMMSVIHSEPSRYYFEVASVAAKIRRAPATKVVEFLHQNPEIMFDLLARMYRGLEGLLDRLAEHMGGSAVSRVGLELVIMAKRFGSQQDDGWYLIQTTDQALADQSGMARETVTRSLAQLKRDGRVTRAHGGLLVDIKALRPE